MKLIPRTTKELTDTMAGMGALSCTQTHPRRYLPVTGPSPQTQMHKCRWAPNLQRSSTRYYSEQQVRCLYRELPIHNPLGYSAVLKVQIPDAAASSTEGMLVWARIE